MAAYDVVRMVISGIHHITAICGSAQTNVDFYARLLGLRLVKVTVNFDDPGSYHLYYGDEKGSPGTCLTFFAWPRGAPGQAGSSQATDIAFSVPMGSLPWWKDRFESAQLACQLTKRDLGSSISFADPDGIALSLIESFDDRDPWLAEGVTKEAAVRGFHSVLLAVQRPDETGRVLEKMGFYRVSGSSERYGIGDKQPGKLVDVQRSTESSSGGVGTIHHVAFATPTDNTQTVCSQELPEIGLRPTPSSGTPIFPLHLFSRIERSSV